MKMDMRSTGTLPEDYCEKMKRRIQRTYGFHHRDIYVRKYESKYVNRETHPKEYQFARQLIKISIKQNLFRDPALRSDLDIETMRLYLHWNIKNENISLILYPFRQQKRKGNKNYNAALYNAQYLMKELIVSAPISSFEAPMNPDYHYRMIVDDDGELVTVAKRKVDDDSSSGHDDDDAKKEEAEDEDAESDGDGNGDQQMTDQSTESTDPTLNQTYFIGGHMEVIAAHMRARYATIYNDADAQNRNDVETSQGLQANDLFALTIVNNVAPSTDLSIARKIEECEQDLEYNCNMQLVPILMAIRTRTQNRISIQRYNRQLRLDRWTDTVQRNLNSGIKRPKEFDDPYLNAKYAGGRIIFMNIPGEKALDPEYRRSVAWWRMLQRVNTNQYRLDSTDSVNEHTDGTINCYYCMMIDCANWASIGQFCDECVKLYMDYYAGDEGEHEARHPRDFQVPPYVDLKYDQSPDSEGRSITIKRTEKDRLIWEYMRSMMDVCLKMRTCNIPITNIDLLPSGRLDLRDYRAWCYYKGSLYPCNLSKDQEAKIRTVRCDLNPWRLGNPPMDWPPELSAEHRVPPLDWKRTQEDWDMQQIQLYNNPESQERNQMNRMDDAYEAASADTPISQRTQLAQSTSQSRPARMETDDQTISPLASRNKGQSDGLHAQGNDDQKEEAFNFTDDDDTSHQHRNSGSASQSMDKRSSSPNRNNDDQKGLDGNTLTQPVMLHPGAFRYPLDNKTETRQIDAIRYVTEQEDDYKMEMMNSTVAKSPIYWWWPHQRVAEYDSHREWICMDSCNQDQCIVMVGGPGKFCYECQYGALIQSRWGPKEWPRHPRDISLNGSFYNKYFKDNWPEMQKSFISKDMISDEKTGGSYRGLTSQLLHSAPKTPNRNTDKKRKRETGDTPIEYQNRVLDDQQDDEDTEDLDMETDKASNENQGRKRRKLLEVSQESLTVPETQERTSTDIASTVNPMISVDHNDNDNENDNVNDCMLGSQGTNGV